MGIDIYLQWEGQTETASVLYRRAFPNIPPQELGIADNPILIDNTKAGNYLNEQGL